MTCYNFFCWPRKVATTNNPPLTRQRSISAEAKMNQLITSCTPDDEVPLLVKCKYAGIIPDAMEYHLRHRLNNAAESEMHALEQLHSALCDQLHNERVQNVAESYRHNQRTYNQLQADCLEFGLEVAEIAHYFDITGRWGDEKEHYRQLRDAVVGKKDCPGVY